MLFHVTQRHIDNGLRENPKACPVARCIKEEIGGRVFVDIYYIEVRGLNVQTPTLVKEFILDYDRSSSGEEPAPFDFELDIEEEELPHE